MLAFLRSRESLLLLPVTLVLAFVTLRSKLFLTPEWFNGTLLYNHGQLLDFTYTNNEQSRLLQFLIPELFHTVLGVEVEHAYILQRFLFTFLAYHLFHYYLRYWFPPLVSLGGVAFLAAITPLSHFSDLQESAPLLLLTFLFGLYAIREKRDLLFAIVLFIGTLNNETVLILSVAFLFVRFKGFGKSDLQRLCLKTVFVSAPAWSAAAMIRFITRDNPHLGGWWHLPDNFGDIWLDITRTWENPFMLHTHLFVLPLFLFGAFWVYAFLRYREQDHFLRRAALIIPLFLAAHLVTGVVAEVRQLLPLSFLIIPMGFHYLRDNDNDATSPFKRSNIFDIELHLSPSVPCIDTEATDNAEV